MLQSQVMVIGNIGDYATIPAESLFQAPSDNYASMAKAMVLMTP